VFGGLFGSEAGFFFVSRVAGGFALPGRLGAATRAPLIGAASPVPRPGRP
jgi:hypothetical protein